MKKNYLTKLLKPMKWLVLPDDLEKAVSKNIYELRKGGFKQCIFLLMKHDFSIIWTFMSDLDKNCIHFNIEICHQYLGFLNIGKCQVSHHQL